MGRGAARHPGDSAKHDGENKASSMAVLSIMGEQEAPVGRAVDAVESWD